MRRRVTATACFTGKQRISRKHVNFELVQGNDRVGWVLRRRELRLGVEGSPGPDDVPRFPAQANIVIEGRGRTVYERLDWGTVARPRTRDVPLRTAPELIRRFRLIVVESSGLIIGECPQVLQRRQDERRVGTDSLLPVRLTPALEQRAWALAWGEEGRPELCLNSRIPDILERLQEDASFQAMVLPAALERILLYVAHAVVFSGGRWDEERLSEWKKWAEKLAGREAPATGDSLDEWEEWIDVVVEKFVERHQFVDRWRNMKGER